jgi:hypothetical protein
MGGVAEGLVNSKPLIVIPLSADNPSIAARITYTGAGISVKNGAVSAAEMADAVEAVITNETYAWNAGRLGKLLKAAGGGKRAADLVFLLLETGGRGEHLVDILMNAPSFKYYAILVGAALCPVVILVLLICFIKKSFCSNTSQKGKQKRQ